MIQFLFLQLAGHSSVPGPARLLASGVATVAEGGRHVASSWREARPVVQGMFQLRFLAGAVVAAPQVVLTRPIPLALGALAWLCATWHVYLVNGLSDQVEDRCNGSTRPLATGTLPVRAARRIAAGLACGALALGALVSPHLVVLVTLMLGLGWLYSIGPWPQKRNLPGFVLVVTAGGAVTYLGGCATAAAPARPELLVLMMAMSLWMALAGTTKDLSDVAGDRAAGRRTLPVMLGDRLARQVMAVLAVGVGVFLLAGALLIAPVLLLPAVVLLVGAVTVAGCALMVPTVGDRRQHRRPYRFFMISQYAVHVTVTSLSFA